MTINDNWLKLESYDARLECLPKRSIQAIEKAIESNWGNTKIRGEEVKRALTNAVMYGTPILDDISKKLASTLRSKAKKQKLTQLKNDIEVLPHLVVYLYSRYGRNAINIYIKKRPLNQASQSRWNEARRENAAGLCSIIYGGLPSYNVMRASEYREIRALAEHLNTGHRVLDNFADEYSLDRSLKKGGNGCWVTEKGKGAIRRTYIELCKQKGRYVPDSEMVTISDTCTIDGRAYKYSSLRAMIKKGYGSVINLFELIISDKILSDSWRHQIKSPTAGDGQRLDSWSEVWWYETLKKFISHHHHDHLSITIECHPKIGSSNFRSDFLIGRKVYIEVLRHPLSSIELPTKKDEIKYASQYRARKEVYTNEDLCLINVEPQHLSNKDWLEQHFNDIVSQVTKGTTPKISFVEVACSHYPGYWFIEENRNNAVQDTKKIAVGLHNCGKFPSQRQFISAGHGGLISYYKNQKKVDWQTEAVKHYYFFTGCFTKKNGEPRMPTKEECIRVLYHHCGNLLLANVGQFSRKELLVIFGAKVTRWLREHFNSIEALNNAVAAVGEAAVTTGKV